MIAAFVTLFSHPYLSSVSTSNTLEKNCPLIILLPDLGDIILANDNHLLQGLQFQIRSLERDVLIIVTSGKRDEQIIKR